MTNFKSCFIAIAFSYSCLISVEQSSTFASSLFPSATRYIAQQPESSSTVMIVQISPIVVELRSGHSSELMGQLAAPLQLEGQVIPVGSIVKLAVIPTEEGHANLIANTVIVLKGVQPG